MAPHFYEAVQTMHVKYMETIFNVEGNFTANSLYNLDNKSNHLYVITVVLHWNIQRKFNLQISVLKL